MKFSDLLFWRKKVNTEQIQEAPGKNAQIIPSTIKKFIIKTVGLIGGSNNNDFKDLEYDLSEIKTAVNADSYIKISMQKYSQLVFKAGYVIVGENDQAAEYIRARFRLMSFATGNPMDITFQEIANDIIRYSNAFLIKSRMDGIPMGGIQAKGVLDKKPVGGYFRVDPSTIKIKRDKSGAVKQYQQSVDSETKNFKPTDVIHFFLDREGGAAAGTPRVIAALEDVKLLRKIEGNVLSLIYRFAIPLYQMKIGLPEAGFMATDKEINEAKSEIEKMSSDGIIVTNERTVFNAIGAEGEALDATGYLSYFEKRCFTALNMSEAMMGRGGSKQDADSMEGQVHNTVKDIQRTLRIFIENHLINELLLEGGYNPIANEKDIVNFKFEEINLDTKVKKENHIMTQFQGNTISFEEMRKGLGQRADNVDESRLYANMVQQKNVLEQIDAKTNGAMQIANTKNGAGIGGNGQAKKPKTSNTILNRNRPQNQYGTTSAKIKESVESDRKHSDLSTTTLINIENYKKKFPTIYKKYQDTRNDICEYREKAEIILPIAKDSIVKELKYQINISAQDGMQNAFEDNNQPKTYTPVITLTLLDDIIEKTVTGLFRDIQKKLKNENDNRQQKEAVFDVMEYRLRFLTEYIIPKAYWYAYVKSCSHMGIKKVYVDFDGSNDREEHDNEISTNHFSLDDIPAFSSYCDCKIQIQKAGE